MASTLETCQRPGNVVDVSFNVIDGHDELVLAAHTDTIQAMLLTASRHPGFELAIKGRVGAAEEARIAADPLFREFTSARDKRIEFIGSTAFFNLKTDSQVRRLRVDQSAAGEPFECAFLSMNGLLEKMLNGQLSANHLLINFGGATDLEIGSDVADVSQLEDYGEELKWEVRARQLGEVPDSIMVSRLQANSPVTPLPH